METIEHVVEMTPSGMTPGPSLPVARGPLSHAVLTTLCDRRPRSLPPLPTDVLVDGDFQLALYVCYELHYRGFQGVSDDAEWDPQVLALRATLEAAFEDALRAAAGATESVLPADVPQALRDLAERPAAPLARFLAREASAEQFREFLMHRSAYHLKEADPHSWAIPRLSGTAKAALIQIQADEYGGGRYPFMHSTLFSDVMDAFGLDTGYGTYLDILPGATLATVNLMSMLGLHRRLRGAIVGHLAAFELGSPGPNKLYARAVRRLGMTQEAATRFFDEHVVADSVHDMVATYDLAGALAQEEPWLAADIVFGARALDAVDARFSQWVLGAWGSGGSSLEARRLAPPR